MKSQPQENRLSVIVAENLPYLRRHARALTGSQATGDRYAATTLEALLADRSVFEEGLSHRVALFKAFHAIWRTTGRAPDGDDAGLAGKAQKHLRALTPNSREVLLLRTIEGFDESEVASVLDLDEDEVADLHSRALEDMAEALAGSVLVIEDEAIIALDIQAIVSDMGHRITGVAPTHRAAVNLFKQDRPDLILSDIQLADGSSGIDAVNEMLQTAGDVPVIFITAFPERLLTGDRPEPAFVITKPYTEDQIRSAVSQAMFFSSTETLKA